MLKMTEAFSKASEYCDVGLCVNASNLAKVSGVEAVRKNRHTM